MEPKRYLILDVLKSLFEVDRRVPGNRDAFPFSRAEWSLPSYFPLYCAFPVKSSLVRENLSSHPKRKNPRKVCKPDLTGLKGATRLTVVTKMLKSEILYCKLNDSLDLQSFKKCYRVTVIF